MIFDDLLIYGDWLEENDIKNNLYKQFLNLLKIKLRKNNQYSNCCLIRIYGYSDGDGTGCGDGHCDGDGIGHTQDYGYGDGYYNARGNGYGYGRGYYKYGNYSGGGISI